LCFFDGRGALGLDGSDACAPIEAPAERYCYVCGEIVCVNHDRAGGKIAYDHSPRDHMDPEGGSQSGQE
jgi:hypothetical protein